MKGKKDIKSLCGELSRKQEHALAALLQEVTVEDAAQSCGVAVVTLYRWFKLPAFATAYREARRQAIGHAITRLHIASSEAVETLQAIMKDSAMPAGARVTACRVILETAVKAVELEDLEARITALEAQGKL